MNVTVRRTYSICHFSCRSAPFYVRQDIVLPYITNCVYISVCYVWRNERCLKPVFPEYERKITN